MLFVCELLLFTLPSTTNGQNLDINGLVTMFLAT